MLRGIGELGPGGEIVRTCLALTFYLLVSGFPASAAADQALVEMAQRDLVALGYDPGNIQGEMSTATIVAVSKFQAEHGMEVTGEVTPQLVGVLRAALSQRNQPAAASASAAPAAPAAPTPQQQEASLQARQQDCLQEKSAAAQERQKTKSGLMRMLNAASRTSSQFGGGDMAGTIGRVSSDVYSANATAADLEQAGKDLGLTQDEMEECRNPP
jgi:peptidoglycan hydrolase-like protein with peptidoglycan-binding domain